MTQSNPISEDKKLPLNQIICGDCLEVMRELPDECIDLIITDPPYKVTSRGSAGNSGGMLQKKINRSGMVFEHNNIKVSDYAPEFYRLLKDGTHCYIMCNHTNLIEMLNTFTRAGFKFTKSLIWDKGNKIMGQFYMNQFEYILFFSKGTAKKINYCGTSDILSVANKKTKIDGVNIHDTEKPVQLMTTLIDNSSLPYEIVLDPFIGSGTTAIACRRIQRNFIGIEKDPTYYQTANDRLNPLQGVLL